MGDIKARIRGFLEEQFVLDFEKDGLTDETDLFESGIVDSFAMVQLLSFLETEFRICIPDVDMASPQLAQVAGIVAYVEKRQAD